MTIEAQVEPSDDERLTVEWYKNGRPLVLGSRINTRFDFGLISLEIMDLITEDSGFYTCRAVNNHGEAITTCALKVKGSANYKDLFNYKVNDIKLGVDDKAYD
ncbi:unnamed protein product, partial [Oppiella nova]